MEPEQVKRIDGIVRPGAPRRTPRRTGRRATRRGFTLLEILVVIGIILLLVAIGVIGLGALDQSAKVTRTTLNNLQSMFAEYQSLTDLREQPQSVWRGSGAAPAGSSLWREPAVIDTDAKQNGQVGSGQPARYAWAAVANTQLVYQYLNRVPANKQNLTKLPSKQVLGTINTAEDRGKLLGAAGQIDPPLVLDAWNNPIIFVGSDGLAGVIYEAKNEGGTTPKPQRVTTGGVIPGAGQVDPAARGKSWRPFFASAGPDGDFKTGDDNIYSFEQQ